MQVLFFSSSIPLYIVKNPVEKLCKVLERELKTYTPVGLKFVFVKIKFKLLHLKIRVACSKALLLTISSSNIVTRSNGYINGDKYFLFYKVSAANLLLELSRGTIQKDHIYHTKQSQTIFRKINCSLLSFRRVKNGYH